MRQTACRRQTISLRDRSSLFRQAVERLGSHSCAAGRSDECGGGRSLPPESVPRGSREGPAVGRRGQAAGSWHSAVQSLRAIASARHRSALERIGARLASPFGGPFGDALRAECRTYPFRNIIAAHWAAAPIGGMLGKEGMPSLTVSQACSRFV